MPSIFNKDHHDKFRHIAEMSCTAGEDTIGKALAKSVRFGHKTIIAIIIMGIAIAGFFIGSLNIYKHLEAKKQE